MKMKCILCAVAALAMCSTSLSAAPAEEKEKVEFKRHWFLQVQAGAAYTLGEVDFGKLVSPAVALYAGHRFSPAWGLRFGLSGWQSKGAWVSPESVYQYKYLQGNVDVTLDLANLFGKFNYRRTVNPYLFAGVGVNGAGRRFPLFGLRVVRRGTEYQHAFRQIQLEEGREPRLAVQCAGRVHLPLRQEL